MREWIDDLTNTLAALLDVDLSTINLACDVEVGECVYTISASSFDEADQMMFSIQVPDFVDALNSETEIVTISFIDVNDEITVNISMIMNSEDVNADLQQAQNMLAVILGDEWDIETEGTRYVVFQDD